MIEIIFLVLGLAGLWLGADLVVRGALNIADYLKISSLFLGLTVISIGTSLPEIAVSVMGGLDRLAGIETSGIVIGNTIGSCLNQITLILGIVVVLGTLCITKRELLRDGFMLVGSIVLFFLTALDGQITVLEGWMLIAVYVIYFANLIREEKVHEKIRKRGPELYVAWDVASLVLGLFVVVFASSLVIDNGLALAQGWGIRESLIGILIIGLGTGLPELSVSISALHKKAVGLSVGNLIGSNITDILLSLGAGAIIAGFAVEGALLAFDIPFLFLTSILVLVLFRRKFRLKRNEGIVLILVYLLYLVLKLGALA